MATIDIAQAIAQMEGYNTAGTLAQRNNNPGNLRYDSRFVGAGGVLQGAVQGDGGFARFPDADAGWAALNRQIELDASRGLTLESFIYKYAPPTENSTQSYLSFLEGKLNALRSMSLADILQGKTVGTDGSGTEDAGILGAGWGGGGEEGGVDWVMVGVMGVGALVLLKVLDLI